MRVLRSIEHTIEGLVERTFGRAFRSRLQPVELARRLAREMEEAKTVSVSRVLVPNEYTVFLSTPDRDRFSSFEKSLCLELSAYLAAYARAEGLSLLEQPNVMLRTDDDLREGEFGIACRTVDPVDPNVASYMAPDVEAPDDAVMGEPESDVAAEEPRVAEAAVEPESAGDEDALEAEAGDAGGDRPEDAQDADMWEAEAELEEAGGFAVQAPPPPVPPAPPVAPTPPVAVPAPKAPPAAAAANQALAGVSGTQILSADDARAAGLSREALTIAVEGRRHRITKRVTTVGRSKDNDIILGDRNASRHHAEIRHIGIDYYLVDLQSTNGVSVNGHSVRRHALAHGDVIRFGSTEARVEASS